MGWELFKPTGVDARTIFYQDYVNCTMGIANQYLYGEEEDARETAKFYVDAKLWGGISAEALVADVNNFLKAAKPSLEFSVNYYRGLDPTKAVYKFDFGGWITAWEAFQKTDAMLARCKKEFSM